MLSEKFIPLTSADARHVMCAEIYKAVSSWMSVGCGYGRVM